jgi:AhpD family alkylhydroperoxidase
MADEVVPGAAERNREAADGRIAAAAGLLPAMLDICFDPQTSGGLLIAVAPPAAESLLAKLREAGCDGAAIIGRAVAPGKGQVLVRHAGRRMLPEAGDRIRQGDSEGDSPIFVGRKSGQSPASIAPNSSHPFQEANAMSCCSDNRAKETPSPGKSAESRQKFQEFLHAAGAPGALDGRTKQAVAVALAVLAKCEPCVKSHVKKAREMGFSQDQIDEAAWMAISFGGSPTMMFYNGLRGDC